MNNTSTIHSNHAAAVIQSVPQTRIDRLTGHLNHPIYTFFVNKPNNLKAIAHTLLTWQTGVIKCLNDASKSKKYSEENNKKIKTAMETLFVLGSCRHAIKNISKNPQLKAIAAIDSDRNLLAYAVFEEDRSNKIISGKWLVSNPKNHTVLYPAEKNQTRGAAKCIFNHLPHNPDWTISLQPLSESELFYKKLHLNSTQANSNTLQLRKTQNSQSIPNHFKLIKEPDIAPAAAIQFKAAL